MGGQCVSKGISSMTRFYGFPYQRKATFPLLGFMNVLYGGHTVL